MEPVAAEERPKAFPVIAKLEVDGFFVSSYLNLSAKIVEPRKVDVENADKYEEDAVFFHVSDLLKELLRVEPGLKTNAKTTVEAWCKDVLQRWNRLDKTRTLTNCLKNWQLPQLSVEVAENEAKNDDTDDKNRNEVVFVVNNGPMPLQGTYVHHHLALWLVLYVSEKQYIKFSEHVHCINSTAINLALQGKKEELAAFEKVVNYDQLRIAELKIAELEQIIRDSSMTEKEFIEKLSKLNENVKRVLLLMPSSAFVYVEFVNGLRKVLEIGEKKVSFATCGEVDRVKTIIEAHSGCAFSKTYAAHASKVSRVFLRGIAKNNANIDCVCAGVRENLILIAYVCVYLKGLKECTTVTENQLNTAIYEARWKEFKMHSKEVDELLKDKSELQDRIQKLALDLEAERVKSASLSLRLFESTRQ